MRQLSYLLLSIILLIACSPSAKDIVKKRPVASSKSFASQVNNDQQKQNLIKENKRCIRCHKIPRIIKSIAAMPMLGKHANQEFLDNCSACHGIKGEHPKQDNTIINLSQHAKTPLQKQNDQCIQCHSPVQLRQAEWTHDVHYQKINCASCHQLHQVSDPIKNILKKQRIQLCVDCHQQDKELL
ncbi:MAG: cytochrome C [Psychromonas sp.]|nr:cytochrome C [Alteromonadales bacterium]MCP5078391.1 cytochrome C [Psychromonas sp.]